METKRLMSIDISRAICIILVVIGHYIPENSPSWYLTIHDVIYTFHMPLFMFLSGYVYWVKRKPVRYKDFIWKKFQRLMIPYFFVSIIVISLKLLTKSGLSVENPVEISSFYKMFYLPTAGFFLWFLITLFLIFLIIPFFNSRKRLFILLILSVVLYFLPISFPQQFCLAQFKVNLLYFVLGCTVFECINISRVLDNVSVLILVFVFVALYILNQHVDLLYVNKTLSILIAFVGIVFISNLSKQIELKTIYQKKIFITLAVYSYSIYLFHTTFQGFVKAIIVRFHASFMNFNEEAVFIFNAIIVVLAGILFPIFMHKIIVRYSRVFSYLIGAKYKKQNI